MFNFSMYEGVKDLVNGVSLLFIYYDGTDVTGHAFGPDDQKVGIFLFFAVTILDLIFVK